MMIDDNQLKALDALRAQRADLEDKIKADEANIRDGVIAQLKRHIREFNITQQQLFGGGTSGKVAKSTSKTEPKYMDKNGNKWSGGRGRVPEWVKVVRAAGGDMEQYRV